MRVSRKCLPSMSTSSLPTMECSISKLQIGLRFLRFDHVRVLNKPMYSLEMFPRKIRNITPTKNDPIILQSYLSMCSTRTRRLLAYPNKLRREVGDSMGLKYGTLSNELAHATFEEQSEEKLRRSFDRAQSIPVVENDLTWQFLEARKPPGWVADSLWRWERHKELQ